MAHPHIFVDAKFEAAGGADGNLSALRHIWRFKTGAREGAKALFRSRSLARPG
ncbi:DUF1007 family protein [Rhizobium leguminosarum]|uniref:DUF1007 family protein n=1 Tax=Rhizobium leguminosarum TaxID=384 RepID=UPI001C95E6C6|nr:DUF1007 family protein [Rhizobium leguminosarum]MBY5541671.1 DUF1007 family protein [Rhizobium leguminosarum]